MLGTTADGEDITPVADNLILDSYNGKEYETVLGSDGRLYDIKDKIEYPKDFVNKDIESIGNNLASDSHEIEVTYKNGDKLKFTSLNTTKARRLAIGQKILGLPVMAIYKDGEKVDELVKDDCTPETIEAMIKKYI